MKNDCHHSTESKWSFDTLLGTNVNGKFFVSLKIGVRSDYCNCCRIWLSIYICLPILVGELLQILLLEDIPISTNNWTPAQIFRLKFDFEDFQAKFSMGTGILQDPGRGIVSGSRSTPLPLDRWHNHDIETIHCRDFGNQCWARDNVLASPQR